MLKANDEVVEKRAERIERKSSSTSRQETPTFRYLLIVQVVGHFD